MKSFFIFLWILFNICNFLTLTSQHVIQPLNNQNLNTPRTSNNVNSDSIYFKTVHLLPHSHWDVGWLQTKQEYYQERVKPIIKAVLKALSQDSNRKFTFVEMSFIEYWFLHDASKQEKTQFIKFLENSQIELSLAGMTMSDEATNTFSSIIHTLTRGHQFVTDFLNKNDENYLPTTAFRIDPFGSTSTLTRLYKESGLLDQIVMRIPYKLQEKLRFEKKLAFFWKLMDGSVAYSQILDYQYCIPQLFENSHEFSFGEDRIAANILHEEIVKYSLGFRNVSESNRWKEADKTMEEIRMGSRDILVPAGCDFTFMDAPIRFRRIENAMRYINDNPQIYPYKVKFSTLGEFFRESKPKLWKDEYSILKNAKNLQFSPTFEGEFMPYSENENSYWTGFFTSYPGLKKAIRNGEAHLRNVKTLLALSAPLRNYSIVEDFKILDELSVVVADLTHHDAITGTSKSFVNTDYMKQLSDAIEKSKRVVENSLSSLFKQHSMGKGEFIVSSTYSIEDAIENMSGRSALVVYNSLAWKLTNQVVEISVKNQVDLYCFFDKDNNRLSTQYVPSIENSEGFDLHILIPTVPALGFTTIFAQTCDSSVNSISTFNDTLTASNSMSSISFCKTDKEITLCSYTKQNQKYELSHHLMRYFGIQTSSIYEQNSGAYIFLPQSSEPELLAQNSNLLKVHTMKDSNMQIFTQVEHQINSYATSFVRIYNPEIADAQGFDLEYLFKVGEIPNNEELIVKFNASSFISSYGEFYCDKNGLETSRFRSRRTAQSSYLPVVYNCFIRDRKSQTRLTLFVSETHGAASLHNGELEIMLHRRTQKDDNRGVAENLNDPSTVVVNIKLRIDQDQHWDEENVRRGIVHAREALSNHFKPLIVPVNLGGNLTTEFSGIVQESKCIHLSNLDMRMNMKSFSSPKLLIQLHHLGFSNCETKHQDTVQLQKMFGNGLLRGCSMNETNLSGSRIIANGIEADNVYLSPYTFRTFLVEPTTRYGSLQLEKEYDGNFEKKEDSFWDKLYLTLKIIFIVILFSCIPVLVLFKSYFSLAA